MTHDLIAIENVFKKNSKTRKFNETRNINFINHIII